ncbi:hypothetical protein [Sphingomonas sp. IC4-52]|uniref:hypothetical protein n=1 Tax=Sphingomonas sp. IC4-52 TaxID=2887202 RepID=UPI001D0F7745|nr:hypothetical protein [Sphingomonas sp. IC4-52]MCC2981017.1 hypothetical protein [Sphingomonas sp. IC4-52]
MSILRPGTAASILSLHLFAAGALAAQDRGGVAAVDQLSPTDAPVAAMQITSGAEGRPSPAQLAPPRAPVATPQVSSGPRSASAPQGPSTARDGRSVATAAVGGQDRCDRTPDAPGSAVPVCAAPIETRAADFRPPAPAPLSPEQRLLIDQQLREAPADLRSAARRLGEGDIVQGSEDQGVAALVLARERAEHADRQREAEQAGQKPPVADPAILRMIGDVPAFDPR